MWDLPGPGIKLVSPALVGGFFTTESPGKLPICMFTNELSQITRPTPEARGGGREDQPHVQGAVAVRAQKGLEELSHVEGQEGWW